MYIDNSVIGWMPLLECWIDKLPDILHEQKELILQLFKRFFPPLLGMRKRNTIKVSRFESRRNNDVFSAVIISSLGIQYLSLGEITILFSQSLYPALESSIVRMAMSLFDCYVSEFTEEKIAEGATSLDLRAQLEVNMFTKMQYY